MIMAFHGCHHQFRRPHEYDEPPLPAPSQYSGQSTTTDGLYASIRPSNITTVGPPSFDDFSEDENSYQEHHASHLYGKIMRGRRWRLCLMVIFFMCCIQMIAIAALGAAIYLHRPGDDKPSWITATPFVKPNTMIQNDVHLNDIEGLAGLAELCVSDSYIKHRSKNCTIFQVLQKLMEHFEKKNEAVEKDINKTSDEVFLLKNVMNGLKTNLTDLLQTSKKDDIPLTVAHLRGLRPADKFTWENSPGNCKGAVRYDTSDRCLTVGREGYFLVYSQLCLWAPGTSSTVTFEHKIERRSGSRWGDELYKLLNLRDRSQTECTSLSGIIYLKENDSVRVDLGNEDLITRDREFNSFGLYMLPSP